MLSYSFISLWFSAFVIVMNIRKETFHQGVLKRDWCGHEDSSWHLSVTLDWHYYLLGVLGNAEAGTWTLSLPPLGPASLRVKGKGKVGGFQRCATKSQFSYSDPPAVNSCN